MSVTVYGSSDDLIEVEGDIREELTAIESPSYVALSNGVALKLRYDEDGCWRINLVAGSGVTITPADGPDSDNYSDRATVDGDVTWVVHGEGWARAKA